ncbi:hypothetical protein HYALB_00010466 [Hymenoscyphus albidus]|uniref:Large ribosomal subunit protein uL29m n=1 Tax=Hymenoscyphus albidus TaxID=595503 RepID=A0A9N9Q6S8_9HELO|nr:hypothetical protein HYALB_00010466 [Hymenoscyphus albidus]
MATSTSIRPVARRLLKANIAQNAPPTFLLPSLLAPVQQSSPFSSTSTSLYPRDMNRQRGVSTRRRTGLRQPLSVSKTPLPKPVLDPAKRPEVDVDVHHGLWDFFYNKKKPFATPLELTQHGRGWTVEELRHKSFEDLHALWWVCCKERNRIATDKYERNRVKAGSGDLESGARDFNVRRTMRGIKHTLTERYYAYREADVLMYEDEEIDVTGQGPPYIPKEAVLEDEVPEEVEAAPAAESADKTDIPPPAATEKGSVVEKPL